MKVIRPTYPKELSIGLLLLIFVIAFFLSGQIFSEAPTAAGLHAYIGMFMVSYGAGPVGGIFVSYQD
jgi:hypothetical protein